MLGDRFRRLKQGTEHLNYGREAIVAMVHQQSAGLPKSGPLQVLDIGFGSGTDLLNVKAALHGRQVDLFGGDSIATRVAQASENGMTAVQLNIESDRLPFADHFFDGVIANQVIEHTKQIFWIVSEVSRVLKKAGLFIVGVPNLAALHNRVLLALGEQPASIELLGPHVRGFTKNSFVRFITTDDYFQVPSARRKLLSLSAGDCPPLESLAAHVVRRFDVALSAPRQRRHVHSSFERPLLRN